MTKRERLSSRQFELVLRCAKGCGAPAPRAVTGIRRSLSVSMDQEIKARSIGEATRSIAASNHFSALSGRSRSSKTT